jgi:hypothetical protein
MAKLQRLSYRIGQIAALIFVGAWFWSGWLENDYVNWPRTPQPEMGRTIPLKVKGITVYIATEENRRIRQLRGFSDTLVPGVIATTAGRFAK